MPLSENLHKSRTKNVLTVFASDSRIACFDFSQRSGAIFSPFLPHSLLTFRFLSIPKTIIADLQEFIFGRFYAASVSFLLVIFPRKDAVSC